MFIGPIIRLGRGLWDTITLDEQNVMLANHVNTPFLSNLTGIARYNAALSLIDAALLRELESENHQNADAGWRKQTAERLQKEFHMAKNDLGNQPATKLDVEELAVAIKCMSLCYDEALQTIIKEARSQVNSHASQQEQQSNALVRLEEKTELLAKRSRMLLIALAASTIVAVTTSILLLHHWHSG